MTDTIKINSAQARAVASIIESVTAGDSVEIFETDEPCDEHGQYQVRVTVGQRVFFRVSTTGLTYVD